MESAKDEEPLTNLRENIAALLDNVSDLGAGIHKQSNILLHKINNTVSTDINNLENISIKMTKLLMVLNVNVIDIIQSLEEDVQKINENRDEKLLKDLCAKILEFKNSNTTDSVSPIVKPKVSDKNTQTDYHNLPINDVRPNKENIEIKSENDINTVIDRVCENTSFPSTSDLKSSIKCINLGLKRSDTQDTEDFWVDSINRRSSALELLNIKEQKVDMLDEDLVESKEKQDEDEEAWDRKTEHLNYDSDDDFVDGKSPKVENISELKNEEVSETEGTDPNNTTVDLLHSNPTEEVNIGHTSGDSKENLTTDINSITDNETVKYTKDISNENNKLDLKDSPPNENATVNDENKETNVTKEINVGNSAVSNISESIRQELTSKDNTENKTDSSSLINQNADDNNTAVDTSNNQNAEETTKSDNNTSVSTSGLPLLERADDETFSATCTSMTDIYNDTNSLENSVLKDQNCLISNQVSSTSDSVLCEKINSKESVEINANLDTNLENISGEKDKNLSSETNTLSSENLSIKLELDSQTVNIDVDPSSEESILHASELISEVLNHSRNDPDSSKCKTEKESVDEPSSDNNITDKTEECLKDDSDKLSDSLQSTKTCIDNSEKDLIITKDSIVTDGDLTSGKIQDVSDKTSNSPVLSEANYSQQTIQLNDETLPLPVSQENSNMFDSDETDFDDNTDKLLSELPSQSSQNDKTLELTIDNEKCSLIQTVTEMESQVTSSEVKTEFDNDLNVNQSQNNSKSNGETFTATESLVESSSDKITKDLTAVKDDTSSQSNKNNENIAELGVGTNDYQNSTKDLQNFEENSCTSSKSFIFDVTSICDAHNNKEDNEDCKSEGPTKETIDLSDSDTDVIHLDVTMEEIVSTGYEGTDIKKQEIEVVDNSKSVIPEENKKDLNSEGYKHSSRVGDELLELLREVEVPSISPLNESKKSAQKIDNKEQEDLKKAEEILKMYQEESSSDISDSESISINFSDDELFEDKSNVRPEVLRTSEELSVSRINQLISKFNIKECCVYIKKLELEASTSVTEHKKSGDSIDRLCDISNLLTKRKPGDTQEKQKSKKVKRSDVSKKGTSDSESSSDSLSDSDFDNTPHNNFTFPTTFDEPAEQKLDDMLANEICRIFKDNSSNDSTDTDFYDSDKTKEAKNRDKGKTVYDKRKKHLLTKEERRKKSWRNDPLLRGKLTSDESSNSSSNDSSDSDKSNRRKRTLKTKYEHDSDFNIITDTDASDNSNVDDSNKIQLENKIISSVKTKMPSSDSSDTDSEVEIIVPKQKTPEKHPETGDQESGPGSSQKGRRNIRALMSDENLAEATQRANKEEQERIERLESRSKKIESLSQSFSQLLEEDELVLDMDDVTGKPLVTVHPLLNRWLKPHQRSGIQFMWNSCYESLERLKVDDGSGCILAHCMGLGKTFQVLALLHALFSCEKTNTKHVLVVCPTSTVNNWKKEIKKVFRKFTNKKFDVLTIVDKKEVSQKYSIVRKWHLYKRCVLVLGYETFETLTNEVKLEKLGGLSKKNMLEALVDPGPDLVVCDEGHLLRNKKALKTLALNKIKTKRRIVLTGTPLQNNLLEYYYMVNFVKPNLLGTMKEYKTNFVNPITNGQYEDSTETDIKLMMKRTHVLHKLLKKTIQRVEDTELKMYLPRMIDHAVFVQLHPVQVELYNRFSKLVEKNGTTTNRKGFLSDFAVFQNICTHPHLLAVMENLRNKKIKERDLITNDEDNPMCNIEGWWKAIVPADAKDNIQYGNKLMVLKSIIEECEEIGDKVLVFSQCLGEMDLIEHFLETVGTSRCLSWKKGVDYCRMDGTVVPALRSRMCDLFNDKDNKKLRLLLMSTKVGGLGLNLTAANRVIIMTVNWNPSYDIQSVFRVYRFGQEKEVYVYRLVALDSMEEKVYQRTVTKLAIAHRVIDKHQITRHYKSMDLQELYSCRPSADIERPISNVPEDKVLAKLILKLPYIFKYHEHQALLANRPEDNLNEQELNAAWDEFKSIKDAPLVVPTPVPQPQLPVPQIPVTNGPTFSMAYDLVKPSSAHNDKETDKTLRNGRTELSHSIPKPSNTVKETKKKVQHTSTKIIKPVSKIPPSTVISLEEDLPTMIPVYAMAKRSEEDPLYIPLSSSNQPNKSYNDMLINLTDKQFTVPKLPKSTSIVLEDPLENNNRKEFRYFKKLPETLTVEPVIINLEDESGKEVTTSQSNGNGAQWALVNHSKGVKRKRIEKLNKDVLLKKMRDGFSKVIKHQESISIDDDDDDVTEVADTTSESGSLSSELITNLGRSGITIVKVPKDAKRTNAPELSTPISSRLQERLMKLFGPSPEPPSSIPSRETSPLPSLTPVPPMISPLPVTPPPENISPKKVITHHLPVIPTDAPLWTLRPAHIHDNKRYRRRVFTPQGPRWITIPPRPPT